MRERIYTIPVNKAFENSSDGCPFCLLFDELENTELDLILGASMMESDIRSLTNKQGFCPKHFSKMFFQKNRLGLALMLESHLNQLKGELKTGGIFSKNPASGPIKRIEKLNKSCYVCEQIEEKITKMFSTAVYLYETEKEFVRKFNSQKMFCLPHYKILLETAYRNLDKDKFKSFVKDAEKIMADYLERLGEDVSWFCKKFDYRYNDQPWKNSKDSVERSIRFLSGPLDLE